MEVSIDYYSATFPLHQLDAVVSWFARLVDTWNHCKGHHGYTECKRGSGVAVYFGGRADMGCYVQVSGEGCALFATSKGFLGWAWFASELRKLGAKENRADVAFDDHSGNFTVADVRACLSAGNFRSRWKDWSETCHHAGQVVVGDVVYLGAPSSSTCLCIYDKRMERLARGEECTDVWLRFELRFKHEQAVCFWTDIIDRGEIKHCVGLLAGAVDFKVPGNDSHVYRRQSVDWWKKFLGSVVRLRLVLPKKVVVLADRARAFFKQHAVTFAVLKLGLEAQLNDYDFSQALLEDGCRRMRERDVLTVQGIMRQFPDKHESYAFW